MKKKIRKKGALAPFIGSLILGIITLLILTTLFFVGPSALFNKVKTTFPTVMDFVPSSFYDNDNSATRMTQDEAVRAFLDLIKGYESLKKDPIKTCFYTVDQSSMKNLMVNYRIELKETSKGTMFTLLRNLEQSEEKYPEATSESIVMAKEVEGVAPCAVYGETRPENFRYNWMYNYDITQIRLGELGDSVTDKGYHVNKDEEIGYDYIQLANQKIIMKKNNQEIIEEWETKGGDYVLWKADTPGTKTQICLFPTAGGFGSCDSRDGKEGQVLDNDCFDEDEGPFIIEEKTFNIPVYDKNKLACEQ